MTSRSSAASPGAFAAGVVAAIALAACVANEDVDLGHNVDAGVMPGTGGRDAPAAGDDATAALLTAAISTNKKGSVCRGDCVSLVASASGAPGPYLYSWGQGLGDGAGPKTVCPAATETYSVLAGSTLSEEESAASVTITVVTCDAGASPPPPRPDAGVAADAGGSLCISNQSFEGPTMIGTSGPPGIPPTAAAPGWQVCQGSPDVDPAVSLLPASDGRSYAGLSVGAMSLANTTEAIGTTLCAPLQPGVHYSFCVDLGTGAQGLMLPPVVLPPVLQIWGGSLPCSQDELLWTSPPITKSDAWTTYCGSIVASQARSNLVLVPAEGGAPAGMVAGLLSYVIVDNIVPGP